MKDNVKFKKKLLVSAVSIALAGGTAGSAYAASPTHEELWQKILQQEKMIEQQSKMIREMQSAIGATQQVTNKHEQQIEQAARTVKQVEVKTAKAEETPGQGWLSNVGTDGLNNKISITGGYSFWRPDDDARTYAITCNDCADTTNIAAQPGAQEHQSNFSNVVGGIEWTQEFASKNRIGADDFALGFNFAFFKTDRNAIQADHDSSGIDAGTPYGTLDSSAGLGIGENEDSAMFFMLDTEYGWHRGGKNNVRLFAGLRIEYLDWEREANQGLTSNDVYIGEESSTFFGIGPRVGASFERHFSASRNLSYFGSVSGGAMVGELNREFDVASVTDDISGLRDHDEIVIVPFGEAEFGLGYAVAKDIQIQIGYQGAYQQDVLFTSTVCTDDNADETKGGGNASCGDDESGVLNHGPFMRFNAYW